MFPVTQEKQEVSLAKFECVKTFKNQSVIKSSNPAASENMPEVDPIQCPEGMSFVLENGASAVVVDFTDIEKKIAQNNDNLSFSMPSGTRLTPGHHDAEVTRLNMQGVKSKCSFKIVVFDLERPQVNCPHDVYLSVLEGEKGAKVEFEARALDNSTAQISYSIPSGTFFPIGNTRIKVQAYDSYGNVNTCSFNIKINAFMNEASSAVATNTSSFQPKMKLFPNPVLGTNGSLLVSFVANEAEDLQIRLSDMNGKVLMRELVRAVEGQNEYVASLNDIVKGTYIIRLINKQNEEEQKIVFVK
jgi:hypothetical protein